MGGGARAAARWSGWRAGDLAERDDDAARRARADGGLRGRGVADRATVRSAIGTATLPALFYLVLSSTGNDFRAAVAAALATSVVGVAAALVIAVVEWRRDVHQERRSDEHHPAEQHP